MSKLPSKRARTASAATAVVVASAAAPPPFLIHPPAHWELPPDVLRCCLLPMLNKPSEVVAIALAFPGAYDVLDDLPSQFVLSLIGAEKLAGLPYPVKRALSSLITSRCEMCGKVCRADKGDGVKENPRLLFAHAACIKAMRAEAKSSATSSRRAKLSAILSETERPSMDQLVADYGSGLVLADDYLGAYLSVRATAPHSLKEALRRVDALITTQRTLAQAAVDKVERAHKKQQLSAALTAATPIGRFYFFEGLFDTSASSIGLLARIHEALAQHGVALDDGDPTHILTPAALADAIAVMLAQWNAGEGATEQARLAAAEWRRKLGMLSVVTGFTFGELTWKAEVRGIVSAALAPHGVALDDPDPSHTFSPAALADAGAAAVKARCLVVATTTCVHPGCAATHAKACTNLRCGLHCNGDYRLVVGMQSCRRHGWARVVG